MLGLGNSISKISSVSSLIDILLSALKSRSTNYENSTGTKTILNDFKNCG